MWLFLISAECSSEVAPLPAYLLNPSAADVSTPAKCLPVISISDNLSNKLTTILDSSKGGLLQIRAFWSVQTINLLYSVRTLTFKHCPKHCE
jgi:hypothetical protein